MNRLIQFVMAIAMTFPTYALASDDAPQTDANIIGHVVDAKTGEHLAYSLIKP